MRFLKSSERKVFIDYSISNIEGLLHKKKDERTILFEQKCFSVILNYFSSLILGCDGGRIFSSASDKKAASNEEEWKILYHWCNNGGDKEMNEINAKRNSVQITRNEVEWIIFSGSLIMRMKRHSHEMLEWISFSTLPFATQDWGLIGNRHVCQKTRMSALVNEVFYK